MTDAAAAEATPESSAPVTQEVTDAPEEAHFSEMSDAEIVQNAVDGMIDEPGDDRDVAAPEAEAPAAEAAPEEAPAAEAAADEDPEQAILKKGVQGLLERERRLRDERDSWKRERESDQLRLKQADDQNKVIQDMQSEIQDDPLGFVYKYGGIKDFDELAQRAINRGNQGANEATRRTNETMADQFKQLQAQMQTQSDELRDYRYQQIRREYAAEVSGILNNERYGVLQSHPDGGVSAVMDLAGREAAADNGLTPTQAADKMLLEYQEQLSRLLSHDAVLSMLQGKATPGAPPPGDSGQGSTASAQKPGNTPNTLTARLASTPSRNARPVDMLDMDEDELITEMAKLVPDE